MTRLTAVRPLATPSPIERIPTKLPGTFELRPRKMVDHRGAFIKVFQSSLFEQDGLESGFVEQYYSVSEANVLRGMHFQTPPSDHAKLVYCTHGTAMDVLLDLRRGSPTYGQFDIVELSGAKSNAMYVPRGVAHGFYVVQAPVIMLYNVTSEYDPGHDAGIAWNSFGAPWPSTNPVVSDRDARFPALRDFESPFRFQG